MGILGCTSHAGALETEIVVGGSAGQTAIVTNAKRLRVIGSPTMSGAVGGYGDVPLLGWRQGYTYAGTLRHGYLEEMQAFAVATRFRRPIGPTLEDGAVAVGLVDGVVGELHFRPRRAYGLMVASSMPRMECPGRDDLRRRADRRRRVPAYGASWSDSGGALSGKEGDSR